MSAIIYKCPNCDGGLTFSPDSQDFACEYCASHFTESQLEEINNKQEPKTKEEAAEQDYSVLYSCPSCGAEVVTDETTAATFCFYCHNPVVLSGRLKGEFKPDSVIPFTIKKDQVIKEFFSWAKKKKYVPKDFVSPDQVQKISGIYFPHWMIDCKAKGQLNGSATKVRSWRAGDLRYTETSYFNVVREGDIEFREIIKNALDTKHVKLLQSVQPFDFSKSKKFVPTFLSGFQAEKRNIEAAQLENEVKQEVSVNSGTLLRNTVNGYSSVNANHVQASCTKINWNYTLLPVWILTYQNDEKEISYFAMNGQTGKINGRLPLDRKKLLFTSAIISGITFLLGAVGLLGGIL